MKIALSTIMVTGLAVVLPSCSSDTAGVSNEPGSGGTSFGTGGANGYGGSGGLAGYSGSGGFAANNGSGGKAGFGVTGGTAGQAGGGFAGVGGVIGGSGSAGLAGVGGTTGSGGETGAGGIPSSGGSATSGGAGDSGGTTGGTGGLGSGGTAGNGGSTSTATGPCDIYASGSTPCVAAHSTIRALYGSYAGNLYQVRRASDHSTKDIGVLSPGGFADSGAQDSFCAGTTCTISIIYDQSSRSNHLTSAPAGGAKKTPDNEANATAQKLTIGGHSVYAVYIDTGMGYRDDRTSGIATGDQPEGEYMVTSGKHFNGGCCFDYGNAETTNNDDGAGTMEAVYFGNCGYWGKGDANGPWVMADLENGLFAGTNGTNNDNIPVAYDYVTAMVKGRSGGFALKGGNAQSGTLKTMYDGARPNGGYNPMRKEGAIILGIGGDNSNGATGTFFEGCMTSGDPSDSTDDAIQANIVAAGYGN